MKKIFFTTTISIIFTLTLGSAFAQTEAAAREVPKWVSDNGYWVIERNTHSPKLNTIYFYNTSNQLVYKEKVDGVFIKVRKRNIKMALKKVLDESVLAYNKTKNSPENEVLVMNLIKH